MLFLQEVLSGSVNRELRIIRACVRTGNTEMTTISPVLQSFRFSVSRLGYS